MIATQTATIPIGESNLHINDTSLTLVNRITAFNAKDRRQKYIYLNILLLPVSTLHPLSLEQFV